MADEAIVPLKVPRNAIPLATHVRGTMIVSSLVVARELGFEGRYFAALPEARQEVVRGVVATDWVPMDVAVDHYGALDSLGLDPRQVRELGRTTSERIQGPYLRTLVGTLRAAGALDPVSLLSRVQGLMDRSFRGASVGVWRSGPKDARCELHGIPALRYAYLRDGWTGAFEAGIALVARKAYVHELPKLRTPTSAAFGVSWV